MSPSDPGIVLEARGLGKLYHLRTRRDKLLSSRVRAWFSGGAERPLWAARAIDLVVRRGECVGVIGPNGAGKTTLLSLLSGLLAPTEGTAAAYGRVSPFLGIGSGLYGELPVIDNLRLTGALFGLTRREMNAKLDEIIAFGELEDYVDARLGELSAGFKSRVSFAVAVHAPIDILLIDEIFAVGDASFMRKCVDKMAELLKRGTATVLASHQLDLVKQCCSRALYLEHGRLIKDGPPGEVAELYLSRHGITQTA